VSDLQQILPGTGRCPVRAEGFHFEVCSAAERRDPSVRAAPCHLPVSGRNMIQSLLIAKILPGTGRCPVRAEGSHFEVCSAAEMWDPSVRAAPCHLPVSGRNMIQSLLIAKIHPGTGRCPVRAEGSHFEVCSAAERRDPSVRAAPCHLPVSGRN
jgi:ribosomal protein L24E